MGRKNKIVSTIILFVCTLIFGSCDSYQSRKDLVAKLSSLYNNNQSEFGFIENYYLNDTLPKGIVFNYQEGTIDVGTENNSYQVQIDSISQMRDKLGIYQILIFMQRERIRVISGNGKEGWITFAFEDYNRHSPCFNFWYRSDFNPEEEYVKREVENIKNAKNKNWIFILDKKGWYIRGVKCF